LSTSERESPKRVPSTSFCEPFREAIELGLSRGRNATGIWQDLVSESGFGGGYQTVKRFVRKLRGNPQPQPRAVILTAPGEEAQVDYGQGAMVRDPQTGKYRRTRLFVMTLGYSRKAIRLLAFRSSSRIWAELHEKAFRRLGGSTRVVVLDNLREGVLVPDIYDPILNPLYRDLLTHYGVVALPCRIKDPDRKGKVEAAYYGLPPGWIGRLVQVQWDELFVRILDPKTGQLMREHVRQKRGWYRIKEEDHPKQKPLRVSQLLWRAGRAGSQIGTLCNLIYTHQAEPGVRRVLGVLSLAKKFGTAAVEDACAAALEMGVHEYHFVRRYLERGPQLTLRQVDPLIRQLLHYRDLINHRTQEQEK
jgi:transposase